MFRVIAILTVALTATLNAGPAWVRIYVSSPQDVQQLIKSGIDDITAVNSKEMYVDAYVPQDKLQILERFNYLTLDPDVAASFEAMGLKRDFGPYYTYEEAVQELDRLHSLYPNVVSEKWSIGQSIEGRELWVIRISDNPEQDEDEPVLFINSAIHAREPGGVSTAFGFIHYLMRNYGVDPKVTWLLDNREFYYEPVVNPDGYTYNEVSNGLWRKNKRDNDNNGRFDPDYDGVDLNRNFGYMWGYDNYGSSPDPSSQTYRGTGPFSEPETDFMRQFADSIQPAITVNYHTYSNLILYSWGYIDEPTPDEDIFVAMAQIMSARNGYEYGRPAQLLYPVNGEANDWFYGDTIQKPKSFSFVIEVGEEFWQPDTNVILEQIEENIPLNMFVLEAVGPYVEITASDVFTPGMGFEFHPGDTIYITNIQLENYTPGGMDFDNVTVSFHSTAAVSVISDSSFEAGHIGLFPDGSATIGDTVIVVLSDTLDDHDTVFVPVNISATYNGEAFEEVNSIKILLGVFAPIPASPTGPDNYGYYAYENLDNYPHSPQFEWIEVAPTAGGPGTSIPLGDDATQYVDLPFTFRFYGQSYNGISICSNGWLAFGQTNSTSYGNDPIPSTDSPNNIVAAYWDDMNPRDGGQVAYYADTANHRFIVEWYQVPHYSGGSPETFEVILYDPAYYPTPTGDGEIVVQMNSNPSQSDYTMGIENASGTDGIQIFYDSDLNPTVHTIQSGFAIKFTTYNPQQAVQEDPTEGLVPMLSLNRNVLSGNKLNLTITLPKASDVSIAIYDASGKQVAHLAPGRVDAGKHTFSLNTGSLRAGIYFAYVKAGNRSMSRKFAVIR